MGQKVRCKKCRKNTKDRCKKCKYGQKFVVYFGGAGYNPVRNHKRGGSVGVQGGKRSMKSKSKPLCCYFHSAYVSVRVVQVPKRGLDLSLLDSPTSTADNSVIFKADD